MLRTSETPATALYTTSVSNGHPSDRLRRKIPRGRSGDHHARLCAGQWQRNRDTGSGMANIPSGELVNERERLVRHRDGSRRGLPKRGEDGEERRTEEVGDGTTVEARHKKTHDKKRSK